MLYMLIYFYIICKYLFRSGFSYLFDKLYLFFVVALLFFVVKFFLCLSSIRLLQSSENG